MKVKLDENLGRRVAQIPLLGKLLIGHGALILLWSAFCLFAVTIGVLNTYANHSSKTEDVVIIVAYGVFGAAALPVGILQIVAGSSLLRNRGRTLAIVALWTALAAFFLGAVFCAPTSIALIVFGMIVLMDPAVAAALKPSTNPT